jgi:hypothetical protein
MLTRESLYIRYEGASQQAVRRAFDWLVNYPRERGFIAVMGYGNLEGVISDVLGKNDVAMLKRTGRLRLSNKEIVLITLKRPIYDGQDLPLVAFWPTSEFIDKLDSIPNVAAMLVVPWKFEEIRTWILIWDATELGTNPTYRQTPLVSNPVVEEALKTLTALVNVSTGISHPNDRKLAIEVFEILRDGGENYTPVEVKAWLIREGGWRATDAQKVAELSQRVLEGMKMRKGDYVLSKDILTRWREQARGSEK